MCPSSPGTSGASGPAADEEHPASVGSGVDGLTEADVRDRIARGDVNRTSGRPSRTIGEIVRANVLTRFNALLGGLLVVILLVGPYQDALFGLVLISNTLIGIVLELRAKRTLDRLSVLVAPRASVVRDGVPREVPVAELVLDDVIEVGAGDQIVVDGEVVSSRALEIDESLVSGESDPVERDVGEALLSGSFVAAGSGRYRATKVGSDAYAAHLADEARRFTVVHSELRAGIDAILRAVTWVIVPTAALLAISQLRSHAGLHDAIRGSVAGTVAMVPEGLVLLTSVAFAVGALRLARRKVLVSQPPAVEVLARVDVLCIDKTGTLTEGRLTVEGIETLASGHRPDVALAALARSDPRPNATLQAIARRFDDTAGWRSSGSVPFSSAKRWSAASFDGQGSWILGAPEVLLDPGSEPSERAAVAARTGRRVLVLARTDEPLGDDRLPPASEAVALVILGDVIRQEARTTLRYFEREGVAVKVISGDHPRTVGAICAELGIPGGDDPLDGNELPEDVEALAPVVEGHTVFGRVGPQQKRAMINALRSRGHVVAMTGDGVNDVLALKDADLGIAMGSGTEATRAVAELVLLGSDFDPLPSVVREGRRVLGNIERTSNLYVTKTVYAFLLSLGVGVFALPFPFLPRHLTLIGALTIGIPSFFLALAPTAERARAGFLRRVLRFTIPAGTLAALATFLGYRLAIDATGVTLAEARTSATMVLCWIGLLILSIIASPLTRPRLLLVWSMAAAFLTILLLPATRAFFDLRLPPPIVWLASFGIAALVWSLARLFIPMERPIGPGRPGDRSTEGPG